MSREILFRGKRLDNGEWVYGNLVRYANGDAEIWEIFNPDIYTDCRDWVIIPETVGQYTGLKDKNDVGIYEGDIVQNELGEVFLVEYVRFGYVLKQTGEPWCKFPYEYDEYEVIGNKWDDPSLLLGGKQDGS